MKHAFLISAHKNYEQLEKLINQLSFGTVFVHVDNKSEELYKKILKLKNIKNYLHVLEERETVNWSGLSQVRAELRLMEEANRYGPFDYYHIVSGQDLLIKSPEEFDRWFRKDKMAVYLEARPAGKMSWRLQVYSLFRENPKNRTLPYRYTDIALRLIQIPFVRRKPFRGKTVWMGSNFCSLTHEAIKIVLEETRRNHRLDDFRYTACADEHYVQMILMNSRLKKCIVQNTGRYICWEGDASPRILTMKDYPQLLNSDCIIARKFDVDVDPEIVERICNNEQIP